MFGQNDSLDVEQAAATDACVLLTGNPADTMPLAYQIHRLSARRDGDVVVLDCASPEPVVEAHLDEWFGTAPKDKADATAPAPGTVLLKNVERLELRLQRKLVTALSRRAPHERHRRQGVIAFTGESLADRVREGTFDGTLFYRLNTIHVVVPAGGLGSRLPG